MTATRAASHTPGPWKVIQHNHADGDLWLSVNQDSDMPHWVAEIKYLATDNEQQWANARLIAAAPELLVELKSRACGGCGYRIGSPGSAMECGSCKASRALVAKAEGR